MVSDVPTSMPTPASSAASASSSMDERLCDVVRQFPELYDKSLEGFKDKAVKEVAWARVAQEVGMVDGKEAFMLRLFKESTTSRVARNRKERI